MTDMTPGQSVELAVAVGRIEEMIKSLFTTVKEQAISMRDLDERVRDLEKVVQRIEANQVPKQPWYSVVGGVVGIISGVGSFIALVVILSQINPTP
jgi:ElaB/YqjD/DUF883 family membrane-anchored ribosome-binding protein